MRSQHPREGGQMHLSLRKLSIAGLVAVSLGLAAAAPSAASSSISVSGTALPTSTTYTSVRSADGNTVIDATGTHAWSGSFTGTTVLTTHFVIHSDGQLTYQGFVRFTGSTPCGAGTVAFEIEGSGPFPGPVDGHATI